MEKRVLIAVLLSFIVLYGYQRKVAVTCAFGLGALSMTMPFISNDYLAVALMGLALFVHQWVAATYIGTVGDVVPQHLAGRVNGIAGLGDNGAALLAVLYRSGRRRVRLDAGLFRGGDVAIPRDGQRVSRAPVD